MQEHTGREVRMSVLHVVDIAGNIHVRRTGFDALRRDCHIHIAFQRRRGADQTVSEVFQRPDHRFRSRAADAAETRVLHLLGGVEHMVPVNRIAPAFHRVAEALREQN